MENSKYKKLIKKDFINLKKEIPHYRDMVWKSLIETLTEIKAKKSRNHTELLLKSLKLPIQTSSSKYYDYIKIKGQNNFGSFNYSVPGDISSCSFFLVLTLLSSNSKLTIKNININKSRIGILKILNKMNANILSKNKKIYKVESISDLIVIIIADMKITLSQ